jgi:uncharacterized protein YdcH (DUF465 family)
MYTRISWQKHLLISVIISFLLIIPTYVESTLPVVIATQKTNHTLLRHQDVQTVAINEYIEVNSSATKQISDSINLPDYAPSNALVELVQKTSMNENGRRIFYLNKPIIETRRVGLDFCGNANRQWVLSGCFVSSKGIFILKVTDPRLEGTMQVSIAHQMLHAAYNQLSDNEKTNLNKELRQVYDKLENTRIKKLVAIFETSNPTFVDDELHSLLGTEVTVLSPALEQHYANYFSNRFTVVTYAQKNERIFSRIADKANAIDKKLKNMKTILDREEKTIKIAGKLIEQQRAQLEKINSPETYNSRLSKFNQRVNNYNQRIQTLKNMIASYNKLVNDYNSLSLEEKSLNNALI